MDILKKVNSTNWWLNILFQIDFEIIGIVKSKSFSFGFTKNISKFIILGRTVERSRINSTKYMELV